VSCAGQVLHGCNPDTLSRYPWTMPADTTEIRLSSASGLRAELSATGALRRFDCDAIALALFVGNEVEDAPTNLYLRRVPGTPGAVEWIPLLGPRSPTRFRQSGSHLLGTGSWLGIDYSIVLALAQSTTAWFWHVHLKNSTRNRQRLDLTYTQDLAIAPYGAVRLNEYYVSQYLAHTPLSHPSRGIVVATRQNLAADGRHPWCVTGSLRSGTSFATDALQFHGLASRAGGRPPGLTGELPGRRLQHEHAMVAIRDAELGVEPGGEVSAGFFGGYLADHPQATSSSDLELVDRVLAVPEARPAVVEQGSVASASAGGATLFSAAPLLCVRDLDADSARAIFGSQWRHEEVDEGGTLLSFFHGTNRHVVLRAKELRTLRPHGHLLRTGRHTTPDETALTSTVWMGGVFHSMLTQGHVNINRMLSTVHSYIGLFRSHGQRVFAEIRGQWQLLDVPSAFEIAPEACLWVYSYPAGVIQIRSEARSDPHELLLSIAVTSGDPVRFLISHHISLNGDDGSVEGAVNWHRDAADIVLAAAPGSDLARRFPSGSFRIAPLAGTEFQTVGGDELLFLDRRSRQQPYLCIVTAPAALVGLRIQGRLIGAADTEQPLCVESGGDLIPRVAIVQDAGSEPLARLADIVPWFAHNALVHYLSPRGLEQYSGGGWGTRDVCQGPVELLFALGALEPLRDLLLRVMKEQNPDGDWPQWFTFFARERNIRAGDSHGDIVFWPLVVLGQYLSASGDAGVLDESIESETVWQRVERALSLIQKRVVAGTALAVYGHGDWNDSLQPADPSLREHMCSAWTVTLHFQMLTTLAGGLRTIGRESQAVRLESLSEEVRRDFQRVLLVDGVLAGYAVFGSGGKPRLLLHPQDDRTGVHYSALAMIHAILEDLLTPEQIRDHLSLIDTHLQASDGVRLFDRPMPYHGGLERLFQRAETATYFGREIGLMYTHAHLRYAQAMAHVGETERFFHALCQANPIAIRAIVPMATLRQANCYYSSSDAAFEDRYQASEQYERVAGGTIALDGGWRVYSSGAGIALSLIVRRFLGLSCEARLLRVDPVMPKDLDGLRIEMTLFGRRFEVSYRVTGRGCGVNTIAVNGQTLTFSRGANPHRPGAALVPRSALLERLTAGQNSLSIDIG
jgi:1,2-beta-oligoglucan phosphorylase